MQESKSTISGNKDNTTSRPIKTQNDALRSLAKVKLSDYQRRVLDVVLWRTLGNYGKTTDRIAVTQIAKDTGIDRRHVQRALKELVARRMISRDGQQVGIVLDDNQWRELPPVLARHTGAPVGAHVKLQKTRHLKPNERQVRGAKRKPADIENLHSGTLDHAVFEDVECLP